MYVATVREICNVGSRDTLYALYLFQKLSKMMVCSPPPARAWQTTTRGTIINYKGVEEYMRGRVQLNRETEFPCSHPALCIWSHETGSRVLSHVSLLILHTQTESGIKSGTIYSRNGLEEYLNASKPSEHPPKRGKNVRRFRWVQWLQGQIRHYGIQMFPIVL